MDIDTGIAHVGRVGWGSHFCHFFQTADDLSLALVPYFKTGLEENDVCIWLTAGSYPKERALAELNTHVPNLEHRLATGQLQVYAHSEWHAMHGSKSPNDVAEIWLGAKEEALRDGYRALRLAGNTAFVGRDDWDGLMAYESLLREAFERQKLIALCNYDAGSCDASAALDVVQRHDFVLARRKGQWAVTESGEGRRAGAELAVLHASFEQAVAARTRHLSEALDHQRFLTAEHAHRVKNTISTILTIAEQTLKHAGVGAHVRATLRDRLAALARLHERLDQAQWSGLALRDLLAAIAEPYGGRVRIACNGEHLTPRAGLDLGLLFNELATNAAKYGGLASPSGRVEVTVENRDGIVRLVWRENAARCISKPRREGFGLKLVRQIIEYDLQGACELRFESPGLECAIEIPAAEILTTRLGCSHASH